MSKMRTCVRVAPLLLPPLQVRRCVVVFFFFLSPLWVFLCAADGRGDAAANVVNGDGVVEHHCGFDAMADLQTNGAALPRLSRDVSSPSQSLRLPPRATATRATAADAWQPLRIRVFTEDLSTPSQYCSSAGEERPDFQDNTITCTEDDVLTDEKQDVLERLLVPKAVRLHHD